ncbi:MAG: MBL fold metallo-hydrolase [Bacteroidales bacterium]|nr:MBL fold metallo-hydrolase [Bacteroidales bacterium]
MAQNSANRLTSFDFDGFTLHILSEGQQQGNKSILLGAADSIIEKYTEKGSFPNAVNCFLVTTQNGKNILVDAGFGKLLFDNLNALNLKPEDIDCILLTHLHGDHIGGLVKDGKITFPNSQVYMSRNEFDYWKKQNNRLAQDVLEKYEKQIHLFVPNKIDEKRVTIIKEIPELSAIAAYGHTPGHTMYLFNSEKPLLIWGDLTHAMAVQMPHPEISVTYDVNPEISAESRLEVLDYVSRNRIFIAGMHIAYPAVGIIKTVVLGKSYVFVP